MKKRKEKTDFSFFSLTYFVPLHPNLQIANRQTVNKS